MRQNGRIGGMVWPLVWLLSGCVDNPRLTLNIVFSDDQLKSRMSEASLFVVDAQGTSCDALLANGLDPSSATVLAESHFTYPSAQPVGLNAAPRGVVLFFFEGLTASASERVRGCAQVEGKGKTEVNISLSLFCKPDPLVAGSWSQSCPAPACTTDADGDGYASAACGGPDCNDGDKNINPGRFEGPKGSALCSDGIDNDCDGLTDSAAPGCQSCAADATCNDGNACNGVESCSAGTCVPGTPLTCQDNDFCTSDQCDPKAGCQFVPITGRFVITTPAAGAAIKGTVTLAASAASGVTLQSVEFFADAVSLGKVQFAPFQISWDASNAFACAHKLKAVAKNTQGETCQSAEVTVTVGSDPPTASLTAPANGLVARGSIAYTLSADASDDLKVTEVEFFTNGVSAGKATAAPYQVTWTPPCNSGATTYTIQAKAKDGQGQIASSGTVQVSIRDTDGDGLIDGCDPCDLTGVSLPLPVTITDAVYIQVTAFQLNGGGNIAQVAPGSTVSLNASPFWRSDACPSCITQLYLGMANFDNSIRLQTTCINPNSSYPSGISYPFSQSFTAPSQLGTYYFVTGYSWDFVCTSWLPTYQGTLTNVVGGLCVQ